MISLTLPILAGLMIGSTLGALAMALMTASRRVPDCLYTPEMGVSDFHALCTERGLSPDATARRVWGSHG